MKIPTTEVECAICHEIGTATMRMSAAEWNGATLTHADPQICIENLAAKEKRLKMIISMREK